MRKPKRPVEPTYLYQPYAPRKPLKKNYSSQRIGISDSAIGSTELIDYLNYTGKTHLKFSAGELEITLTKTKLSIKNASTYKKNDLSLYEKALSDYKKIRKTYEIQLAAFKKSRATYDADVKKYRQKLLQYNFELAEYHLLKSEEAQRKENSVTGKKKQ